MAKSYRTGKRSSAAASSSWAQIVEACRAVVERAQGRREMGRFGLAVDASTDTLGRMLDDPQYGGWTGPRILAMRQWEEDEYGTHQIREAMGGAVPDGRCDDVERDADAALVGILGLSRQLAEMRPKGYDRRELRILLPAAREAAPLIAKFIRDTEAALKSGRDVKGAR